ncbi:uncharacterized protein J3D65DRAFT_657561 [Phyllosticta citribraziliensis]|uniref:Uncharacterized protein n=1 Tax=Phyllosticta citribraziliensis TaxID=989973 RepID=A0ABR1M1W6_9PEZI
MQCMPPPLHAPQRRRSARCTRCWDRGLTCRASPSSHLQYSRRNSPWASKHHYLCRPPTVELRMSGLQYIASPPVIMLQKSEAGGSSGSGRDSIMTDAYTVTDDDTMTDADATGKRAMDDATMADAGEMQQPITTAEDMLRTLNISNCIDWPKLKDLAGERPCATRGRPSHQTTPTAPTDAGTTSRWLCYFGFFSGLGTARLKTPWRHGCLGDRRCRVVDRHIKTTRFPHFLYSFCGIQRAEHSLLIPRAVVIDSGTCRSTKKLLSCTRTLQLLFFCDRSTGFAVRAAAGEPISFMLLMSGQFEAVPVVGKEHYWRKPAGEDFFGPARPVHPPNSLGSPDALPVNTTPGRPPTLPHELVANVVESLSGSSGSSESFSSSPSSQLKRNATPTATMRLSFRPPPRPRQPRPTEHDTADHLLTRQDLSFSVGQNRSLLHAPTDFTLQVTLPRPPQERRLRAP